MPGVLLRRRYRCACTSCAGAAESPATADSWHLGCVLKGRLRHAKRNGHQWRQEQAERQSLAWLTGLQPHSARRVQKVFDELFELDVRLACEASGRRALMRCLPHRLRQMLCQPRFVLARPDWLREFIFSSWLGVPHAAENSCIPPAHSWLVRVQVACDGRRC